MYEMDGALFSPFFSIGPRHSKTLAMPGLSPYFSTIGKSMQSVDKLILDVMYIHQIMVNFDHFEKKKLPFFVIVCNGCVPDILVFCKHVTVHVTVTNIHLLTLLYHYHEYQWTDRPIDRNEGPRYHIHL